MDAGKPVPTAAALRMLQANNYRHDTLMVQLELSPERNLMAIVSCFKGEKPESKKRSAQIMKALDQQHPDDLLHKGQVAEMLLPFLHIGRTVENEKTAVSQPRIARAYGKLADCVLKSFKFSTDTKATGFYRKNGLLVVKLQKFELPAEGWTKTLDGSRFMHACFGIRVLEKVQMASPAIMAALDEDDQEDLEACLEDEDIDEIVDEYERAKENRKAMSSGDGWTVDDEFHTIVTDLQPFLEDEEAASELEAAIVRAMSEPEDVVQCDKAADTHIEETQESGEQLDEESKSAEPSQDIKTSEPKAEKPQEEAPALEQAPQQPNVQQLAPVAGQKRQREELTTPEDDERAKKSKPTPLPSASQIAGKKRGREDDLPEESNKKSRSDDILPSKAVDESKATTQVEQGGSTAKAAGSSAQEIPSTVAPSEEPESLESKFDTSENVPAVDGAAERSGGNNRPKLTLKLKKTKSNASSTPAPPKQSFNSQVEQQATSGAASNSLIGENEESKIQSRTKKSFSKGKGKAVQLATPEDSTPEDSTPEDSTPEDSTPEDSATSSRSSSPSDKFVAPTSTNPTKLDQEVTHQCLQGDLNNVSVKKMRDVLKQWGFKPARGSTILSRMKKDDLIDVVRAAVKARHRRQVDAQQKSRNSGSGSMSQRAGISKDYSGLTYDRSNSGGRPS